MATMTPSTLLIPQIVPSAPYNDLQTVAVDWLPGFSGQDWVAYGTFGSIVITSSPFVSDSFPTECGSSAQIILTLGDAQGDGSHVLSVNWLRRGQHKGDIAGVQGSRAFIYSANSGSPISWRLVSTLSHDCQLSQVKWTGSGDGVLCVGQWAVAMWQRCSAGFQNVWSRHPAVPQHLAATTWTAVGPCASADSESVGCKEGTLYRGAPRGTASVWFRETSWKLPHPDRVLSVQWRPQQAEDEQVAKKRQRVLLTFCADGAARLWMEPPSNLPHLSHVLTAVIDVAGLLAGSPGADLAMMWAEEKAFNANAEKDADVAPCEWLIGAGKDGDVALWAVHCLDDVAPFRSPRTMMWRGTCQLAAVPNSTLLFCSVERTAGLSGSPVAADVALCSPSGEVLLARVWPPGAALAGSRPLKDRRRRQRGGEWGATSQSLRLGGHSARLAGTAVLCPALGRSMAASLACNGQLLIWQDSGWSAPDLVQSRATSWHLVGEVPPLHNAMSAGRMQRVCWLPWQLPGGAMLLAMARVGDPVRILSVSLRRQEASRKQGGQVCQLAELGSIEEEGVEGVYFVPAGALDGCLCVVTRSRGISIWDASWDASLALSKRTKADILCEDLSCLDTCADSAYQIVTGHSDGQVRFWTLGSRLAGAASVQVGLLHAHSSAVLALKPLPGGIRLATVTHGEASVRIWTAMLGSGFEPEATLSLPAGGRQVAGLDWCQPGNGALLLAVACTRSVHVFCEAAQAVSASLAPASEEASGKVPGHDYQSWNLTGGRSSWGGSGPSRGENRADVAQGMTGWQEVAGLETGGELVHSLTWHRSGRLVIGVGHQLWFSSQWLDASSCLLEVSRELRGFLPAYHPAALFRHLALGDVKGARCIIRHLVAALASEGVQLADHVEGCAWMDATSSGGLEQQSGAAFSGEEAEAIGRVVESKAGSIPQLSEQQVVEVRAAVDAIRRMDVQPAGLGHLDPPARRFWLWLNKARFEVEMRRKGAQEVEVQEQVQVGWKEVAWMLQSECKETALREWLREGASWQEYRALGAGYWQSNLADLRQQMEKVARVQFLQRRDPKDCALLYLSLDRRAVLLGLLRLSRDDRDRKMWEFMGRNFQEEKNRSAALMNAYQLLSQHRYELAAAFFVLGGDVASAATVCAKNMKDAQLALVVARLADGPHSSAICREVISRTVLPEARRVGDSWQACALQWLLGNKVEAARELIGEGLAVDPDAADLCAIIAGSASLALGPQATECRKLVDRARLAAAFSLSKLGLPLQALDLLPCSRQLAVPRKAEPVKAQQYSAFDFADSSSEDEEQVEQQVPDCEGGQVAGRDAGSWLSEEAAARVRQEWRLELVRAHLGALAECLGGVDPLGEVAVRRWVQKVAAGVQLAESSWGVPSCQSLNPIVEYTSHRGTPSILHRLLTHLPPQTASWHPASLLKCTLSDILTFTAPYLANILLASWNLPGGSSSGTAPLLAFSRDLFWLSNGTGSNLDWATLADSDEGIDHRDWAVVRSLGLLCLVADAWLARHPGRLLSLLRPIVEHPASAFPFSEPESTDWMLLLQQEKQEVAAMADEDSWLVLGAVLWSSLHDYFRRKLCGASGSGAVSFSSYGWMTPVQNMAPGSQSRSPSFPRSVSATPPSEALSPAVSPLKNGTAGDATTPMGGGVNVVSSPASGAKRMTLRGSKFCQAVWSVSVGMRAHLAARLKGQVDSEEVLARLSGPGGAEDGIGGLQELWNVLEVSKNAAHAMHLEGLDLATAGRQLEEDQAASGTKGSNAAVQEGSGKFMAPVEVLRVNNELLEAVCVNYVNPRQVAIATNRKGIIFADMDTHDAFTSTSDTLFSESDWPRNGWAGAVCTPPPSAASSALAARKGSMSRTPSHRSLQNSSIGGIGMGIPGYGGIGAWGLGWEDLDDAVEGYLDPPADEKNVSCRALSSHPLRPLFLVGSNNTHIYLWEFGKPGAMATYGVLPPPDTPIPLGLPSVMAVRFDCYGHRFVSGAADGSVSMWHVEVGGRSNVGPTETSHCFSRHAWDVAYVGQGSSLVAAAGHSTNGANVVLWDSLSPPQSARLGASCHEGGCMSLDTVATSVHPSPLIVSGGKSGDICVHDMRKMRNYSSSSSSSSSSELCLWRVPRAHTGSVAAITAIPGSSLFLSGSKEGEVRLWDASTAASAGSAGMEAVSYWPRVHEKHTFLNARGFGAVLQVALTGIIITPSGGVLSCGGDGAVKHFALSCTDL